MGVERRVSVRDVLSKTKTDDADRRTTSVTPYRRKTQCPFSMRTLKIRRHDTDMMTRQVQD